MSREEVFEKLNEVFRDVFDDEEITVTDATTADDIEEWDSLEHINLLAAVEQEFPTPAFCPSPLRAPKSWSPGCAHCPTALAPCWCWTATS